MAAVAADLLNASMPTKRCECDNVQILWQLAYCNPQWFTMQCGAMEIVISTGRLLKKRKADASGGSQGCCPGDRVAEALSARTWRSSGLLLSQKPLGPGIERKAAKHTRTLGGGQSNPSTQQIT